MKHFKNSYDYARDLLGRVNSVRVQDRMLSGVFNFSDPGLVVSLWSFQQFFLMREIGDFAKRSGHSGALATKSMDKQVQRSLVNLLLRFWAVAISLITICRALLLRVPILVYSVDKLDKFTRRDPRLAQIYTKLEQGNVRYTGIVHSLLGREFLSNSLLRLRPVIYLEAVDAFYPIFKNRYKERKYRRLVAELKLDEFSEDERAFVRGLLKHCVSRCLLSEFRVRVFLKIFSWSSLRAFISIDDIRHANELLLAAHIAGVTSYVFQHSNFDYLSGLDTLPPETYIFPDHFYVWNTYWLKRIPELSPLFAHYRDRLRIGGRANGYVTKEALFKGGSDGRMTILLPYEVNVDKREILPYIEQLVAHPDTKILFKTRSDMSSDTQVAEYLISGYVKGGKIEVVTHLSDDALRDVDVVLGVYTTFLDEMIERGKPVGVFTTSYPVFNDLARSGIAGTVHLHRDVYEQVKVLSKTSKENLLRNRGVFLEGGGSIPETVRSILKSSK